MKTIICHNGQFHADEITAIALALIFLDYDDAPIHRSREQSLIDGSSLVIDVGGIHDPQNGKFDHHHFDKDHKLYGKSSAGLIWDHIKSTLSLGIPYTFIDFLVKDVDAQDTGIKLQEQFHFCNLVSSFNTEDVYSRDQDAAFLTAIDFVQKYLQRMMAKADTSYQQAKLAKNTPIQEILGMKIACLARTEGYISKDHFIGLADILISWDSDQKAWTVLMLAIETGSFTSKYTLEPAEDLQEVFTHKAGFIGKYKPQSDGTIYFRINKGLTIEAISMEVA